MQKGSSQASVSKAGMVIPKSASIFIFILFFTGNTARKVKQIVKRNQKSKKLSSKTTANVSQKIKEKQNSNTREQATHNSHLER